MKPSAAENWNQNAVESISGLIFAIKHCNQQSIQSWPGTDLCYSALPSRFVFGKKLFHSLMNLLAWM